MTTFAHVLAWTLYAGAVVLLVGSIAEDDGIRAVVHSRAALVLATLATLLVLVPPFA